MRKLILTMIALTGLLSAHSQTEDTLVVELLYRADQPTEDDRIYIDRAAIYYYGDVVASAPLDHFDSLTYKIKDTFGVMGADGEFRFYREMLPDLKDKIPAQVRLNGKEVTGFVKISTPKSIRFNFYTDEIKPVLNFWINVEGISPDSTILPLAPEELLLSTSYGEIRGLELILPPDPIAKYVTITACLISKPSECIQATLPVMDRDAQGHWADEEDYNPSIDAEGNPIKPKDENPNVPGYHKKTYYFEDADTEEDDSKSDDLYDDDPLYQEEESQPTEEYDNKWDYLFKKVFRKG